MLVICHILSTGKVMNPSDLELNKTTDKDKLKYTRKNFERYLKQLFSLELI